jgi:curved DNA-binding protein CbpA
VATRANDAYAVLGLEPSVDDDAIQIAYRALARRFHPDIAGETATKRMMRINAAFDRVRDPIRRAEYDIELDEIDPARAAAARRRPQHHDPASPVQAKAAQRTATAYQPYDRPTQRDGTGSAGRPPGRPSGTVLDFGRHMGWSLGEIARVDPGYLVWLEDRPEGKRFAAEIDGLLRRTGFRVADDQVKAYANRSRFHR